MMEFGVLNWAIVGGYIALTMVFGALLSRRVKTDEHYYLGDRTTPWWAIGLSVAATYFGALTFLGGPAWSYETGLSVILIHVNYPIAVFIVVTLFLPFFYNIGVASIFDYLERRFGIATRTLMSFVFLFVNLAYSGIMLYTTSLVLSFITGLDVSSAIIIVALAATIYTLMGGISAVIWTDVAQSLILVAGVVIVLALVVLGLPDGLGATLESLKSEGKTDALNYSLDPSIVSTVWTGIIAMSIYHVTVYGVNQMMVQRTLTAKSIGDAKKSYILMGYLAFPIFFLFFFLGVLLSNHYDNRVFDDGNLIMLNFVAEAGVPGLMGLVAAAVVAAAMSSLDSSLNSMATVTTIDFYQKFWKKNERPQHYLVASRVFTVFWAAIIIIPALLFIGSEGSVLEILSKIGSFFVGAKLSTYFLGFYSKHATEKGVLIGVVLGFVSLAGTDLFFNVAWPWYCLIGGGVSIFAGWAASLILDGKSTDYHSFTVKGQKEVFRANGQPEKDGGWYILPGKVDRASYGLIAYFLLTLLFLYLFHAFI